MADLIIKTGRDSDGLGVFWVLDVPPHAALGDVMAFFGGVGGDGEELRFVWPWAGLVRRAQPGRQLTLREAAAIAGQAPITLRRAIAAGRLPARRATPEGFRGGERPYLVNENDLRWYMGNRAPRGGPARV
jgi:hypothetical protein